ncbi:MAG: hypothetical protein WKF86_07800 [Acidimicrobiales bacterium]
MGDRWVVLGLAPARCAWFGQLAHWATAGTVPVELLRCQSVEELRARLAGPRPVSAALVDAAVPGLDRDLLSGGPSRCPVVVVGGRDDRWSRLGAAAVLDPAFNPIGLLDALAAVARPVVEADRVPGEPEDMSLLVPATGGMVAVCGTGGSGTSTVAVALAQGLAAGAGQGALPVPVVLADLCRRADQAMLHDVRDVLVGTQELVEAHRSGSPEVGHVRAHCLPVPARGYDLLLGLRQPRAWAALRPRAVAAAIDGLRRSYGTVVADIEGDLEGEAESGSVEVEERHALARTAVQGADVVLVVGSPGLHGIHGLARLVHEVVGLGVHPMRILPVVSQAPKRPGPRAELTAALAQLCATPTGQPAPPLLLPARKVDEAFRDGSPLPDALATATAKAASAVAARAPVLQHGEAIDPQAPRLVRPGSLGALVGGDDDAEGTGGW